MKSPELEVGHRSKGFTLIELVITISIIAILAAVALPRYISLQSQARQAKMMAIFGGVRSAAALAHAQAIATNIAVSGAATIQMEGVTVNLIHGYPTAAATGMQVALPLNTTADQVTLTPGAATPGASYFIDMAGATAPGCRVTYTAPTGPNLAPVISVPAVPAC